MADKKMTERMSFKIGEIIGELFGNIIFGIIKIIYRGIKVGVRNKILGITYIILSILITILLLSNSNFTSYLLILTIGLILIVGIKDYIEEYPVIKKRKLFNRLFEEIKLISNDGKTPYFLGERVISKFVYAFAFNTLIPVSKWIEKKETLEMYLNTKIIDIEQNINNNRIIYIYMESIPLPSMIEWRDNYLSEDKNILNIGLCHFDIVGIDLKKHPHTFIAGETGSGKSNILKCLIYQSLMKDFEVTLIDFKRGVSFFLFSEFVDIYYEYDTVCEVLKELVKETNKRLDNFRKVNVDNIDDYNKVSSDYFHRRIIFIDELAELLKTRDKNISNTLYDCLETLTRLSRATGIHLIMGIQRPDSTIISGQIKNNVPFRICGRFIDKEPSRIMLGSDIASNLENIKGRFIVKNDNLQEVQSFYFTEDNINLSLLRNYKKTHEEEIEILEINEELEQKEKLDFDFSQIEK